MKRSIIASIPRDWKPTQAVPEPVINNPYKEPEVHWVYEDGMPYKMQGRRPASYWFKETRTGSAQQTLFQEESRDDLPLVNALREDIKRWRESGYRGASSVTRELFNYWFQEDKPRRLFFCQIEAVETIIYLLEIAISGRLRTTGFQKFNLNSDNLNLLLRGERPDFKGMVAGFHPQLVDIPFDQELIPLTRMACKMATGSGKTIVMAMIITWAFCNRFRNPGSIHFPNAVLIVAPNLTVKKRLSVLRPENKDNYFNAFDLVPSKYREALNSGKVIVQNWHKFAPKSEHDEGGKSYSVVNKGEETADAFTIDRLGELANRMPILVLNDEGHHCWRSKGLSQAERKQLEQDLSREEKSLLEEEEDEARVWLNGLDKINNSGLIGKDTMGKLIPGILSCIDLSATPFYLSNSGFPEGSPFPWIVSDFGLVDAIESGITKVPRLPIKDDSGKKDEIGRPDPVYFRMWEYIKGELNPSDFLTKKRPKPESIYKYAEPALQMLAGQWLCQFKKTKEESGGQPFIPPVMIVVCNETQLAEVFFRKISGEFEREIEVIENGEKKKIVERSFEGSSLFEELQNSVDIKHTIRIDSRLLAKLEAVEGETKDQSILKLREIIDTVGKRGHAGEQVRCVVSVSMLTEGWDASNVTHILGVRAFDSQLLCEQVVGRGLRRINYTPDRETGLLPTEYVDVFGIPFSLIPFKGRPKEKEPTPDPVYHSIYAVEERADFEIRMPVVESYVYSIRESGIKCNVDDLEGLIIDHFPGEVYLAPTRGYYDDSSTRKDLGDFERVDREEYYKTVRLQQILFKLTHQIVDELIAGSDSYQSKPEMRFKNRQLLFPDIFRILNEYVNKKISVKEGLDLRELGSQYYSLILKERIRDNILPVASQESKLLPILNRFEPFTTTAKVSYQTTKRVMNLTKSHLNRAMLRSSWEGDAISILENTDCVECFTPNDRNIGLLIPYEYQGVIHNYEPDFIVRLQNNKYLLVEIKGPGGLVFGEDQVNEKNASAKKWVEAVNNLKTYGNWEFVFCDDLSELRNILEESAGVKSDYRPFLVIIPDEKTAWINCVPLTTLEVAAGLWSQEQTFIDYYNNYAEEWITWNDLPKLEKGMFVAKVVGKSMEPTIPSGSYCLFRQPRSGSRQGRIVLVWHEGIEDPNTGGCYTVKEYESEKKVEEGDGWMHTIIKLKPHNNDFPEIILTPEDEGQVRIIAEFITTINR